MPLTPGTTLGPYAVTAKIGEGGVDVSVTTTPTTKERLLESGAKLFAEKGFAGVSARSICADADTSVNMVHYYFGSKKGLLSAIAEQLSAKIFAIPIRLFQEMPASRKGFASRMQLLFETTLEAHIEHRTLLMVVVREEVETQGMQDYSQGFAEFLERAKREGFVRQELDSETTTGAILDRILNQVAFAPWVKRVHGVDILTDDEYQKRWCKANLDLFLNGIAQS
jgi:AcrR family transcriptional regulator